jgi:predicted RNA-binding Zn-ribbon protein involved in translation (DUF1610 family)
MKETLWEEKSLTEPKMNCENKIVIESNNTINEIKSDCVKNECDDIGNEKKKWVKNCPKCGVKQVYTSKHILEISIEKNTWCNKCSGENRKIKIPENGWAKTCPNCNKPQKYSCKSSYTNAIRKNKVCGECSIDKLRILPKMDVYSKYCPDCGDLQTYSCRKTYKNSIKNGWKCKKCRVNTEGFKNIDKSIFKTEEYRKRQSEMMFKARKTESYGEGFKEKLRKHRINSFRKNGKMANYNPIACGFIDGLNKKMGWNLKHALNGGEVELIGYFLDGYDKEQNIIFEYDEPKHDSNYHKNRDLKRQLNLIGKIKPSMFIRHNETLNKTVDILDGKEIL